MKNKKKSLNPNKFWFYSGHLPATNLVSGTYQFTYKVQNQMTIFMETLMTRNFNLLIRRVKGKNYRYRKHFHYIVFNFLFFNFLKVVVYKYKNNAYLLQFLHFYLRYLHDYILVKKINIRARKAAKKKKIKKKKIKEHYLRAVPRYFKEFYCIKKHTFSFINATHHHIYCLGTLPIQKKTICKNSRWNFSFGTETYARMFPQKVKPLFLHWMFRVALLDNRNLFYYQQNFEVLWQKEQGYSFFRRWAGKKINFLLYYSLIRLNRRQVQQLTLLYSLLKYRTMQSVRNSKKKKRTGLRKFNLQIAIKKQQYIFWYNFKHKKRKAFKKLVRIAKIFLFSMRFTKCILLFKLIFADKKDRFICFSQLFQSFFLKQQYLAQARKKLLLKKNLPGVSISIPSAPHKYFYIKRISTCLNLIPFGYKKRTLYVYQKKLLQLLFIQKYLENYFSKTLRTPVLIRFINLFFLQTRLTSFKDIVNADSTVIKKNKYFFQTIKAFLGGFYFNNPLVIAKHIAYRLQQTGRRQKHTNTINEIFYLLKLLKTNGFDLSGFQILLCGKVNAKTQTKVKYLKWGPDLRTNTFSYPLQYIKTQAVTYTGVFGVHIWFIK